MAAETRVSHTGRWEGEARSPGAALWESWWGAGTSPSPPITGLQSLNHTLRQATPFPLLISLLKPQFRIRVPGEGVPFLIPALFEEGSSVSSGVAPWIPAKAGMTAWCSGPSPHPMAKAGVPGWQTTAGLSPQPCHSAPLGHGASHPHPLVCVGCRRDHTSFSPKIASQRWRQRPLRNCCGKQRRIRSTMMVTPVDAPGDAPSRPPGCRLLLPPLRPQLQSGSPAGFPFDDLHPLTCHGQGPVLRPRPGTLAKLLQQIGHQGRSRRPIPTMDNSAWRPVDPAGSRASKTCC